MSEYVILIAFALVACVASTWYWWLQVRYLETLLGDLGYRITDNGYIEHIRKEKGK